MTSDQNSAAFSATSMLHTLTNLSSFPGSSELPAGWMQQWTNVWASVAARVAQQKTDGAFVIGIHGGQGSGKSTLSKALAGVFREAFGWNTVVLSIDDLYLPHQDRQNLSRAVHPLLSTRGVPGTHDAELGCQLISRLRALQAGDVLAIPSFDKASDDRLPEAHWHQVSGPVDLVLFEGWCVGCRPVSDTQLAEPVNTLEAQEDTDGEWRRFVNEQLSTDYQQWFGLIDYLIMLKVPDMEAVLEWRGQQEQGNKACAAGHGPDRSLDDAKLKRFIQHYERLTRQALEAMPGWANLIISLNPQHQVDDIRENTAQEAVS